MTQRPMKKRKLLLFPLLGLLALTSLFSCGEDRWKEYYPLTGRDLWMDSLMREVYLWYEDIPASKELNYFQDPEAFLKSILSSKDKNFSTVDTITDAPLPSYGFDYTLYKVATSDTTYNALVSYVALNSPAEDAGLERGDWIMLIDGDSITKKTEERLTDGGARKLRIGKYVIVKNEESQEPAEGEGDADTETGESGDTDNDNNNNGNNNNDNDNDSDNNDNDNDNSDNNDEEEEDEDEGIGVIQEIGDVTLPAVRSVTEKAVYKKGFITLAGHKVAYLAYNSFTAGTAENSEEYNDELRTFSRQCMQEGIDNFVLDLRYNAGGEMECVQLLADILVPADKLESPFAFLQYNDKQSAKNRDLILDSQLLQGGVNLNLSKVYIITSGTTAGAAEMLINCLKPYMTVILIGQSTKGEYVATETFINPKYPWAVRPVVCEVFNSEGEADYSTGFKPDISVNESSYLPYYLPLGSPYEILLNTALGVITGAIELPEPQAGTTAVKSFATKKNVRKGLIVK